jgi:hypothetical protein
MGQLDFVSGGIELGAEQTKNATAHAATARAHGSIAAGEPECGKVFV